MSSTVKITAKAEGDTYVFAIIENGKLDFCKVTVVDQDTYDQLFGSSEEDETNPEPDGEANESPAETDAVTLTPSPTALPEALPLSK